MELINCVKHNDTYLMCKNIYTITECKDTSSAEINSVLSTSVVHSTEVVNSSLDTKYPDTIWNIPIIISIIIASCLSLLIIGTMTIRVYRSRTKLK
jgi:hypothetical protein